MPPVQFTPPPLSSQAMADLLCTIILLCRGTDENGKPRWSYMCVKPSMAKAFRDASNSGAFNLEDYGTVIAEGEGEDVPPDIAARMARDYGVNSHFEDDLIAAIEEQKRRRLEA